VFPAPPGTTFERLLGRGALFEVAVVVEAGERLAAKRPLPSLRGSEVAARALERETAVLSHLRDPRVPKVHRIGFDAAGPFVVESLVEGVSMRGLAERTARLGGDVVREIAALAVHLLGDLHDRADDDGPLGFFHGDLSPEHLIVTTNDAGAFEIGLVDFGSAGARGAPPPEPRGRGTLPYLAPELCRAERPASAATDRYAVAVLIGQWLTGGRLCSARTTAAMLLEIGDHGHDTTALASLPAALCESLTRHLAFRPEARPADLADLARALEPRPALD
jgi:serine/threonine-protein kinase